MNNTVIQLKTIYIYIVLKYKGYKFNLKALLLIKFNNQNE